MTNRLSVDCVVAPNCTSLPHCVAISKKICINIGPRFHLFPRDPGKDAVQGPPKLSEDCRLRSSRSPRTVLEARGLHLSQRSRGKRWILDIIPRFCRFRNREILGSVKTEAPPAGDLRRSPCRSPCRSSPVENITSPAPTGPPVVAGGHCSSRGPLFEPGTPCDMNHTHFGENWFSGDFHQLNLGQLTIWKIQILISGL